MAAALVRVGDDHCSIGKQLLTSAAGEAAAEVSS
jgi:hypothetical protein